MTSPPPNHPAATGDPLAIPAVVIDLRREPPASDDMAKQRDAAAVARDAAAEARDVAGVVDSQQVVADRVLAAGDRAAAVLDGREAATMRTAALARDTAAEARDLLSADASEARGKAGERVAAALDRHAAALRDATESAMEIAVEVRLATWTGVGDEKRVASDRLLAAEDRAAAALDRQGAALMRAAALARDVAAEARDERSADANAQQGAGERELAAEDRAAAAQDRQDAAFDRHAAADDLQNAYRDDLTGALLRDAGCEQLSAATDRAHRTGESLVFAFLDVDHLKLLNDTGGHDSGDVLLRMVGKALRHGLRTYDVVVRYGGDEFVCAMPGSRLPEAETRFNRVSQMVSEAMSGAGVSFGLAELGQGEGALDAIARADTEMYRRRRLARGELADVGPSYRQGVAQLRIGLAQVDSTVGDLPGNADVVSTWTRAAVEQGCHLVAFPEMMLTGYPPEDLVLRSSFVSASLTALDVLAARLADEGAGSTAVVVGYCGRSEHPQTTLPALGRPAGEPQNAAALLHGGRVIARYAKHHLPNYGVFDEFRYFVRGDRFPVVRLHGVDIGLVVCEDLWQDGGPIAVARSAGVGLVVCINGSPYERGKDDVRGELACRRAREAGAALAYVNTVGGQDELVFDGDSLVTDADGRILSRAPVWSEQLLVTDLDLPTASSSSKGPVDAGDGTTMTIERIAVSGDPVPTYPALPPTIAERLEDEPEVWGGLVTATRDYVRKNGFRSVVLGLSGGIDSAVVATIAADALGPDAVHVVGMPSAYSSDHSVSDAEDLAKRQGLQWSLVPIAPMVEAWQQSLDLTGLAVENLQARVRGTTLMALSNEHGHLVLTTGNKSELATGFSTLYGDSAGGFAPIKDVPKSMVWRLARWRNTLNEVIPPSSIDKPPSAELAPGQLDSDRLPPYDELDALLDDYVGHDLGRAELLAKGHAEATVDRVIALVDAAEYKRRQYPPGPKITSRAFGRDRRLPITSRWREVRA